MVQLLQIALAVMVFLIAMPFLARWWSGTDTSTTSGATAPTTNTSTAPWQRDELVPGASTARRTAASATAARTSAATTAPMGTGPTQRPTAATPSYPPAAITGEECVRQGTGPYAAAASGNARTSCAFAIAVRTAYLEQDNPPDSTGAVATVTAYSQARQTYVAMRCRGGQPVRCDSADGATVYLYGGEAVRR